MIPVYVRQYWIGSVFVAEWDLVDTANEPVVDAVVSGTVATPSGELKPMTMEHEPGSGTYRGSYKTAAAGDHGWRLQVDSGGDGAVGGSFFVNRDITGRRRSPPTSPRRSGRCGC